jgi:hypothetical protein
LLKLAVFDQPYEHFVKKENLEMNEKELMETMVLSEIYGKIAESTNNFKIPIK